jgi:hypothetical protein
MISLFKKHALPKEEIKLNARKTVRVSKFSWKFPVWQSQIKNTYGGKAVLDYEGEGVFAELAIIPVLRKHGFEGAVWVDTYRGCFRDVMPSKAKHGCGLPAPLCTIYCRIAIANGGRAGCWDVMAWNKKGVTFVELKRKGKDRMRSSGVKWLRSALKAKVPLNRFVICEWDTRSDLGTASKAKPRRNPL